MLQEAKLNVRRIEVARLAELKDLLARMNRFQRWFFFDPSDEIRAIEEGRAYYVGAYFVREELPILMRMCQLAEAGDGYVTINHELIEDLRRFARFAGEVR